MHVRLLLLGTSLHMRFPAVVDEEDGDGCTIHAHCSGEHARQRTWKMLEQGHTLEHGRILADGVGQNSAEKRPGEVSDHVGKGVPAKGS